MLSFSRTEKDKQAGTGRIYIAKARTKGDGILFPVLVDWAKARAIVLDKTEENLNTINTLQDNSMSIATREKLKKQLSKFLNSKG